MSKFEKIDKCPKEKCYFWDLNYNVCGFGGEPSIKCILDERLKNLCELK